ncbi:magnesium transporter [Ecytonucleospora hepatopenaei]|uniref:Magnesium transporter n=1 Tax=Ecytonucleospora hepatopenaei TaxID=646526 RepID=A0A1W0E6S7_9MICR|nr:magnesium transporter [Ecytonucleospora hepatopenaei]
MEILKYSTLLDIDNHKEKNETTLKTCQTDNDCRITNIPDFNSLYCVNSKCIKLKGEGMPCYFPEECASYNYHGPFACSSTCKVGKLECKIRSQDVTQNNKFCCRGIPLGGECNFSRPGQLSGCNGSQICTLKGNKAICAEKKERSWILAVFCSISGNVLITIGINLQKRSYKQNYMKITNFWFANLMRLGVGIYIAGKLVSFSAYIFGNQSLMAGLSAIGLVANSIFAPFINNEIFSVYDAVAIFCAATGSTILVQNTKKSHTIYTLCELFKMYYNRATLIWFAFILFMILFLYLGIKFVEVNSDWDFYNDPFKRLFKTNRIYYDEDSITCKYLMVLPYVFLSSFIASFTTLFVKSFGEIANKALNGNKMLLLDRNSLFFISGTVICTIGQIYWLNRALKHYDALLAVPIFHISWTLLSIFTAGIYFKDFDNFSTEQLKKFTFGLLVIFCGSIFLGLRVFNKARIVGERMELPSEEINTEIEREIHE